MMLLREKKYILLSFCLLMMFAVKTTSVDGQDRKRLEKEKAKLEKEISSMNAILNETKKTKRMSSAELQIIRKKIDERQKLINNITSQITMLNDQIKTTQQSITESYRDLEVLKENYAQMLRYAQRNKTATDKLLFIFAAKDYKEAYQRYVFFRQFGEMQRKQILAIENKTKELSTMTSDLLYQKRNQSKLLRQEQANTNSLTQERQNQEQIVQQIKQKEKQITKQIKQKEAKKRQLQSQINAAINAEVRKQQQIVARKRKAAKKTTTEQSRQNDRTTKKEVTKQEAYVMSATPKEEALSNGFASNRGRLPWPVSRGVIVSSFGVHPHPDIKGVQIENLGVDIRTTKGATVRSVYEGEVCKVWAGPNGKKVVLIRHGEYMTVYTNLQSVSVRDGMKVSTGQAIGVIATNENNQSEMNFQVRKGVKCQNPSIWLKR
ncbi:MAG: peptidoglycan DD-metalloendopeptidase family protein [Bacteroidales bacterium]|jgi:septal ring factor EnvC (AmiA/AmiB activator)|nr:peptidoglycan DD-metalloendopeptidase family protein [Bacteroidales bacterium]